MTADVRDKGAQRPTDRLALRVYYEDTDFSGRVYHASYLRFLERGRTEWLRARGFEQRDMAANATIFVVRRLAVDFVKPAAMDDVLIVETSVAALGAASLDFAQRIFRGPETVALATVGVAALKNGKPARLPADLRGRLAEAAPHSSAATVAARIRSPRPRG